jgi:calcium-translocating P-type ATPase
VRIRWPGWQHAGAAPLRAILDAVDGAHTVRASTLTGNVLVLFDPELTDADHVIAVLGVLRARAGAGAPAPNGDSDPPTDDPPEPGRSRASPARSRIAAAPVASDPAAAPRPADGLPGAPPDPTEVLDSAGRLVGAAAGLALLGLRRLVGRPGLPPGATAASVLAATGAVVEGVPELRHAVRERLGPGPADVLFAGAGAAILTLSGSPLGLAVAALVALRELSEVRARSAAWTRYQAQLTHVPPATPGERIALADGDRSPLDARVVSGDGSAIGRSGLPERIVPGSLVSGGARVYGGPFVLELGEPAEPSGDEPPGARSRVHDYAWLADAGSLAAAALVGFATRSPARALVALLLLGARPALEGADAAERGASARMLRLGATVVDRRPGRGFRRPDCVILETPRVLVDGLEIVDAVPLDPELSPDRLRSLALGLAAAGGWPWGPISPASGATVDEVEVDDGTVHASVDGQVFRLSPAESPGVHSAHLLLELRDGRDDQPLGLVALRPKLRSSTRHLVGTCRRLGIELVLPATEREEAAARDLGERAGIATRVVADVAAAVRALRADGRVVAVVSDSPAAAAALAAADLAVGVSAGRTSRFPTRVDVLVPDLGAAAAIVESCTHRDLAAVDAMALALTTNVAGALWLVRGGATVRTASLVASATTIAALVVAWARLRGGTPYRTSLERLVDPRPERWGRRSVEGVLEALGTRESGLTSTEAEVRRRERPTEAERNPFVSAVREQLDSPLTAVLATGAVFSLLTGSVADVALILAVIAANASVGALQEAQVGRAAQALEEMTAATAWVLRDGGRVRVDAAQVVPGDILLLSPGERVAADARLLTAYGLEVEEAALTGESLPVAKSPTGGTDASRVVLEGSGVAVGRGRAVVFAVGDGTRLGATAAALSGGESEESPLGARLNAMLAQALPLTAAGGLLIVLSGLAWRRPLLAQLTLGASAAIAAVPEGLPLLAGIGQAAVARRLARRNALVRRLSAVEALGRVDVACVDKTGTLTEGRLALHVVAGNGGSEGAPDTVHSELRNILLAAAVASPRPSSSAASAHPTDAAVLAAAREAGLTDVLEGERRAEAPFDPARPFHAALLADRLCVKGSTESLLPRCDAVRAAGRDVPLDDAGRAALLARAENLADRGLRVLLVAEGPPTALPRNPQGLAALGFLGLRDSLREGVSDAVARCRTAGVRLIMLTGDHPVTARTIAAEIGLLGDGDTVLTGDEIADLSDAELDARLERATVIARISPLEKLRIVRSLKRGGHVVAMTGDGVNDAPALRLADVGVAMGRSGTEVARQAAEIVLADDDFSTLVEALVEGRTFWRNTRRAVGMLLGGNLGEVGFIATTSLLGLTHALTTRQILAVNLGSDVVPAMSLAVEDARGRDLSTLAREGTSALGAPLWGDILHRAAATALPSLAAFLAAMRARGPAEAQSVAFASVVVTQLAQTVEVSAAAGGLSRPVITGAAGSTALLAATVTLPPLRRFFGLSPLSPVGWLLVAAAAGGAVALSRAPASLEAALTPLLEPAAEPAGSAA